VLAKNNIYSVPIFSRSSSKFEGFLDLLDVITFIILTLDDTKSDGGDAERPQKKRRYSEDSDDASVDFHELLKKMEEIGSERSGNLSSKQSSSRKTLRKSLTKQIFPSQMNSFL
jgi:hypothetical protein